MAPGYRSRPCQHQIVDEVITCDFGCLSGESRGLRGGLSRGTLRDAPSIKRENKRKIRIDCLIIMSHQSAHVSSRVGVRVKKKVKKKKRLVGTSKVVEGEYSYFFAAEMVSATGVATFLQSERRNKQ